MVEDNAPYLCNHCGGSLTENNRCGTYMKCHGCGNYGNMADVASIANNLENKVKISVNSPKP